MAFSSNSDSDEVLGEINITPLVDVMLVLLVAFMLTIPAMNNAVHINLPKTATTTPPEQQKAVTVSVDAKGVVFVDKREVPLAQVEAELKGYKARNPDVALHLQADETVPYGPVAKVMASIERAGISKVSVLTATQ